MSKQLLTDSYLVKFILNEDKEHGVLVASGPFGRAGIPTANKRIYPVEIWERELKRIGEDMNSRKIFGELDHPGDGKTKLSRVSHLVTDASVNDDGIILGKAEILQTGNGNTLRTILDAGGKVGVSSRGYGSVKQNSEGYDVVQDDFQFVTFDFVADPAASNSYPEFKYEEKKKEGPEVIEMKKETKIEEPKVVTPPAPELKEEKVNEVEKLKEEHAKTLEGLKVKFESEFLGKLKELSTSIREEVREELMKDPTVAGAKATLESVKGALRPYILGEDVDKELGVREKKIQELESRIQTMEGELNLRGAKLEEFEGVTKELGYKLFMERFIASHPKRLEIVEKVGDVIKYNGIEELKVRIEKVLDEYKWVEDEKSALEKSHKEEMEKLESQVTSLKGSLEDALVMSRDFGIEAYLEKRLATHPRASRIRDIAESMKLSTKEDVDRLVESVEEPKPVGDFRSRIRRYISNDRLVEGQIEATQSRRLSPITEVTGQSMEEINRLSGLKRLGM